MNLQSEFTAGAFLLASFLPASYTFDNFPLSAKYLLIYAKWGCSLWRQYRRRCKL
jgi:hypothetical protein